jgi:hypothetical protein
MGLLHWMRQLRQAPWVLAWALRPVQWRVQPPAFWAGQWEWLLVPWRVAFWVAEQAEPVHRRRLVKMPLTKTLTRKVPVPVHSPCLRWVAGLLRELWACSPAHYLAAVIRP